MATVAERTTRRGMTFPFFLSLVYFVAVLCDNWLGETDFITSIAYRHQGYIAAGLLIFGFLLWLWVLTAARRRAQRFEGPIETARGANGALQPILATIFIVSATNLAYSHTLPKWLNAFASNRVVTQRFVLAGEVAPYKSGCHRAPATNEAYGTVALCLPERLVRDTTIAANDTINVSGPVSWFGIEATRYSVASAIGSDTAEPVDVAPTDDVVTDDPAEPDGPLVTPPKPPSSKLGNQL